MAAASSSRRATAWRHSSSQKVGLQTETRDRDGSASNAFSVAKRQASMSSIAPTCGGTASRPTIAIAASPKYAASDSTPIATPLAVRPGARPAGLIDQ
jgi:hypothetical protein